MMQKFKCAYPMPSLIWPFLAVFLLTHFLHLSLVAFIEFVSQGLRSGFFSFWIYAIAHSELAILHYLLISGLLILVLIFAMRLSATQFTQVGRLLSLFIPWAPIIDIVFHFTNLSLYKSFRNYFQSEIEPAQRLAAAMVPGVEDGVIYLTWGHRIVFVLMSFFMAAYVWRSVGGYSRPIFALLASYLAISAVLAFLSPSDIPPPSQVPPLVILTTLLWVGNLFLLMRREFISNKA